jgi:ribonuclease HI
MKKLKFDHELAQLVRSGEKTSTWRLFDDKDLSVHDQVELIDKVDENQPDTWQMIGVATITAVSQKRLGDINDFDMAGHEAFESREQMMHTYRRYYGPNVTPDSLVKIVTFNFQASTSAPVIESSLNVDTVKVFADGGSRGNPGPSASGFVVLDANDKVLVDKGVYLGLTTNNQAEYTALKLALEEVTAMGATKVDVYMDSMLVVNQMKGIFKIKNGDLRPIHDAIKLLAARFKRISYTHVPRELNKLADAAVNRALDEALDFKG